MLCFSLLPRFSKTVSTWILISGLSMLLVGCGDTELYTGLQEKEANMMLAMLLQQGIDAKKTSGTEATATISVPMTRFAEAVALLTEYGYPRSNFQGVGVMFGQAGLVSSPTEERIRYMYALSQDLAESLTLIDGVVDARVHVVLPDNNPFSETIYPASASVFIDYRPDSNVLNEVAQIKDFVVTSIEGLSVSNVNVALFPVEIKTGFGGLKKSTTTPFLFFNVPNAMVTPLTILMGVLIFILVISVLIAVYYYLKKSGSLSSDTMDKGSGGPSANSSQGS